MDLSHKRTVLKVAEPAEQLAFVQKVSLLHLFPSNLAIILSILYNRVGLCS